MSSIFLYPYFIWLYTHCLGSLTCIWKGIFILKSSNMINWCSPSFLSATFWADIDAVWENSGTRGPPWHARRKWLYLNKLHICFRQNKSWCDSWPSALLTHNSLAEVWHQHTVGNHLTACEMTARCHNENNLFTSQVISESNKSSNFWPTLTWWWTL